MNDLSYGQKRKIEENRNRANKAWFEGGKKEGSKEGRVGGKKKSQCMGSNGEKRALTKGGRDRCPGQAAKRSTARRRALTGRTFASWG